MKKLFIKFAFAALALTTLLTACEKNELNVPTTTEGSGARIRFINAAFNITDANNAAMQLDALVGNRRVNGTQRLTTGAAYPSVSGYLAIPAGNTEYSFNRAVYGIQLTGKRDSLRYSDSVYLKGSHNFENGKFYSIFMIDSLPNLRAVVLEDNFKNFQDTLIGVRFVHFLTRNGEKNDTLELIRRRGNVTVVKSITFGKATDFTLLDVPPAGLTDSFFYRRVNTTLAYPGLGALITANTFAKGRNQTIFTFGTTSRASAARTGGFVHQ